MRSTCSKSTPAVYPLGRSGSTGVDGYDRVTHSCSGYKGLQHSPSESSLDHGSLCYAVGLLTKC